jgi:transcriptional regulator with XRE-family HTH domain
MNSPDRLDDRGSRARVLGDRDQAATGRAMDNRPDPAERERLARTLGATLRTLREAHELGTRRLAQRAACARSTVTRLERGERRPRASLLAHLAYAMNPGDPEPLREVLIAAAGESLAPESEWSERRRLRAMNAGVLAGEVPLPGDLAEGLAMHRRADMARQQALALMDDPANRDDAEALGRASALLEESATLSAQAGPPVIAYIGGREIRAGFGV